MTICLYLRSISWYSFIPTKWVRIFPNPQQLSKYALTSDSLSSTWSSLDVNFWDYLLDLRICLSNIYIYVSLLLEKYDRLGQRSYISGSKAPEIEQIIFFNILCIHPSCIGGIKQWDEKKKLWKVFKSWQIPYSCQLKKKKKKNVNQWVGQNWDMPRIQLWSILSQYD